jgi:hypothetical protein
VEKITLYGASQFFPHNISGSLNQEQWNRLDTYHALEEKEMHSVLGEY